MSHKLSLHNLILSWFPPSLSEYASRPCPSLKPPAERLCAHHWLPAQLLTWVTRQHCWPLWARDRAKLSKVIASATIHREAKRGMAALVFRLTGEQILVSIYSWHGSRPFWRLQTQFWNKQMTMTQAVKTKTNYSYEMVLFKTFAKQPQTHSCVCGLNQIHSSCKQF